MNEEIIDDWEKVFESPEIMEAELIEARLKDEGIEYQAINKLDLGYTTEIGQFWTFNSGKPVKIFVHPNDKEKALSLINEDRSNLLDYPDLDFGKAED
jgi:Putative prokaryotic signal transducing protein